MIVNTTLLEYILKDSPVSIYAIAKSTGISQGSLNEVRMGKRGFENLRIKTLVTLQEWADENFKESWDCEELLNDLKEDIEEGINHLKVLTVREYHPLFNKYLPVDYFYLDEMSQVEKKDGEIVTLDKLDDLLDELEQLDQV